MWDQLPLSSLPIVLAKLDMSHITRGPLFPYLKHRSFIPKTSTESPRDTGFFLPGSSQGSAAQETDR